MKASKMTTALGAGRKVSGYRLAFLSVVGYNHFYIVRLCHLSSAFLSGLCVGYFNFFEAWVQKAFGIKNNFSFGSALQAL